MGAKVIVVGTDFHFGKNRSGSITDLEKLEEECGYHLIVVEKLQLNGKDISSTRIRASLEKGAMEEAKALLGRNYSVSGEILHGNALGRTIQVPTINQQVPSFKLLPPNGVFLKSTGKTKFTTALPTSEPSQLSTIPAKKQSRPISLISIKMFMAKKWS